ncbi:MAG: type III-A CRISPR-associated RAMP protein Csm5 [Halanaerobiales bacterium]|nr:type III-A CRISPR-associated RAMP protein Csm5 [Halanaerobiales bacterium]
MKMILETLTPVHIGSGEILSPYSDYVYQNGSIYYIDNKKLGESLYSLEDADEIIDQFVEIIRTTASNNRSKFKLVDFFDEYDLDYKKYSWKKVEIKGVLKNEQISRMVTTAGKPFIPGSSLKGAIRTCLLYGHLKADGYDFNKLKKISLYIGQDKFDSFGNDILKFLHVTDTTYLKPDQMSILKTVRWNLDKHDMGVPIWREVIPSQSRFELRLQSKAVRKYDKIMNKFQYLYEDGESEILRRINEFYIETLEHEIETLSQLGKSDFSRIIEFYEKINQEAKEYRKNQKGAILRIGAGKTFFENTVSFGFKEDDFKFFKEKLMKITSKSFPKTRTIIVDDDIVKDVLGWARISVSKED